MLEPAVVYVACGGDVMAFVRDLVKDEEILRGECRECEGENGIGSKPDERSCPYALQSRDVDDEMQCGEQCHGIASGEEHVARCPEILVDGEPRVPRITKTDSRDCC